MSARHGVIVDLDEPVNPIDDLPAPEHQANSAMVNFEDEIGSATGCRGTRRWF